MLTNILTSLRFIPFCWLLLVYDLSMAMGGLATTIKSPLAYTDLFANSSRSGAYQIFKLQPGDHISSPHILKGSILISSGRAKHSIRRELVKLKNGTAEEKQASLQNLFSKYQQRFSLDEFIEILIGLIPFQTNEKKVELAYWIIQNSSLTTEGTLINFFLNLDEMMSEENQNILSYVLFELCAKHGFSPESIKYFSGELRLKGTSTPLFAHNPLLFILFENLRSFSSRSAEIKAQLRPHIAYKQLYLDLLRTLPRDTTNYQDFSFLTFFDLFAFSPSPLQPFEGQETDEEAKFSANLESAYYRERVFNNLIVDKLSKLSRRIEDSLLQQELLFPHRIERILANSTAAFVFLLMQIWENSVPIFPSSAENLYGCKFRNEYKIFAQGISPLALAHIKRHFPFVNDLLMEIAPENTGATHRTIHYSFNMDAFLDTYRKPTSTQ